MAAAAFNNGNLKRDSQSKKRSRKMIEGRANGRRERESERENHLCLTILARGP